MVMTPRRSCVSCGISRGLFDGHVGKEGGLTKKRMIHVSMTVRFAGRMENQDMEGGEQ